MKSHIKIVHEGIRKYQCDKCNYKGGNFIALTKIPIIEIFKFFLGQAHNLKSHMESVHGKKDFKLPKGTKHKPV